MKDGPLVVMASDGKGIDPELLSALDETVTSNLRVERRLGAVLDQRELNAFREKSHLQVLPVGCAPSCLKEIVAAQGARLFVMASLSAPGKGGPFELAVRVLDATQREAAPTQRRAGLATGRAVLAAAAPLVMQALTGVPSEATRLSAAMAGAAPTIAIGIKEIAIYVGAEELLAKIVASLRSSSSLQIAGPGDPRLPRNRTCLTDPRCLAKAVPCRYALFGSFTVFPDKTLELWLALHDDQLGGRISEERRRFRDVASAEQAVPTLIDALLQAMPDRLPRPPSHP